MPQKFVCKFKAAVDTNCSAQRHFCRSSSPVPALVLPPVSFLLPWPSASPQVECPVPPQVCPVSCRAPARSLHVAMGGSCCAPGASTAVAGADPRKIPRCIAATASLSGRISRSVVHPEPAPSPLLSSRSHSAPPRPLSHAPLPNSPSGRTWRIDEALALRRGSSKDEMV